MPKALKNKDVQVRGALRQNEQHADGEQGPIEAGAHQVRGEHGLENHGHRTYPRPITQGTSSNFIIYTILLLGHRSLRSLDYFLAWNVVF